MPVPGGREAIIYWVVILATNAVFRKTKCWESVYLPLLKERIMKQLTIFAATKNCPIYFKLTLFTRQVTSSHKPLIMVMDDPNPK